MTLCTADFQLGTHGATVTTGDAGSATPWDSIVIGASASNTYQSTVPASNGGMSNLISTGGSGNPTYNVWNTQMGTITDHYGRLYLYVGSTYPSDIKLIEFRQTGASAAYWGISSGTSVYLKDSTFATTGSFGVTFPVGALFRMEWHVFHSTTVGYITVRIFLDPRSSSPTATGTTSLCNTKSNANEVWIGPHQTANIVSLYMDDIVVGAPSYPLPYGVDAPIIMPGAMIVR